MKWFNRMTGGYVETDKKLKYPYVVVHDEDCSCEEPDQAETVVETQSGIPEDPPEWRKSPLPASWSRIRESGLGPVHLPGGKGESRPSD